MGALLVRACGMNERKPKPARSSPFLGSAGESSWRKARGSVIAVPRSSAAFSAAHIEAATQNSGRIVTTMRKARPMSPLTPRGEPYFKPKSVFTLR